MASSATGGADAREIQKARREGEKQAKKEQKESSAGSCTVS